MQGPKSDPGRRSTARGRRVPGTRLALGAGLYLVALFALAPGCAGQRKASPFLSEVTYSIPDDFKLAMMRFERRLEAHDIEGVLRSFDPLHFQHFRGLEKAYLDFARRSAEIEFTWRVSDVRETTEYREFEVPWEMTFVDSLHAHRVRRHGVSAFQWSREPVPRLVGLGRDRLFPEVRPHSP